MECAFTLSKTGTLYKANSKTATKEKCDNSKQFSEANWGAKARAQYKQAKGITAELWNVIETDTRAICDNGDLEAMGDDAGTASSEAGYNPDEMVVWDW